MVNGELKFLYIAPERFEQTYFEMLLRRVDISLVAFDEAHCISKWGHDFRPSYQAVIQRVLTMPQQFSIVALTATATTEVQQDIMERLMISRQHLVKTSIRRRNLKFQVNGTYQRQKFVLDYIQKHSQKAGLFIVQRVNK